MNRSINHQPARFTSEWGDGHVSGASRRPNVWIPGQLIWRHIPRLRRAQLLLQQLAVVVGLAVFLEDVGCPFRRSPARLVLSNFRITISGTNSVHACRLLGAFGLPYPLYNPSSKPPISHRSRWFRSPLLRSVLLDPLCYCCLALLSSLRRRRLLLVHLCGSGEHLRL